MIPIFEGKSVPFLTAALVALFPVAVVANDALPQSAIVYIHCETPNGQVSKGSGVIFTSAGHVLTAKHVAGDGSTCKGLIGSSDSAPERILDRRKTSDRFDFATLQFRKRIDDKFRDLEVAPKVEPFDQASVKAAGFPARAGSLTRRQGQVSSVTVDSDGLFDIGTNTATGMSGGPVMAGDKLIGIVARADFDQIGQAWRYAALASDKFYETVSQTRHELALDVREAALADLREGLSGDAVCAQLLREAIFHRYPDAVPGLAPEDFAPPSNKLADEAHGGSEYWVTINTGPARWIECSEETPAPMHFFPMGLLLRPVRDLTLRDANGGARDWTIFQAEYGLLVLIPREAVAPVTRDVGYIFPEGTFVHKLCGPVDEADCNPGENLPPLNNYRPRWPVLAPWESYLRTTETAALEALNDHHRAYTANRALVDRYLENNGTLPFGLQARAPQTLAEDPACVPHEAYLYNYGKAYDTDVEHDNAEYGVPVSYSLCTQPPAGAERQLVTPRPAKIVTYKLAEERFAGLWSSAVEFQLTDVGRKARDVLQHPPPLPVSRLECGRDVPKALSPLETADARGQGMLDVMAEANLIEAVEDGFAYHIKPYRPARGRSPSQIFHEIPLYQDIELKVYCGDDRRPVRAREVRIHLYPLFTEPLSLDFESVENWFLTRYEDWGFEGRRHLSNGYLERICDYPEYYAWRDTLEKFLKEDAQIIGVSERKLQVDKSVTASHFAHLIMAMLFFTEVPLKDANNYGVCPL